MLLALALLCAASAVAGAQTTGAPRAAPDTAVRTLRPVATEGLVLGGGGSRGWAHAGALEGLERRGHDADLVVGTSIGALVGALYAAGYSPDEIQQRIRAESWGQIFTPAPLLIGPEREARHPLLVTDRDVDPLRFNRGFVPQWRINRALVGLLFDAGVRSRGDFDRLARRFRAVATDLRTGDSVVLARGDLARAARASMAVPGVFAPVEWEGRSLVDGGLSTNVPVPVAREMGAQRVIAVDIGRPEEEIEGRSPLEVVGRAIDILQQNAERHSPPADVWVVPEFDPAFYGVTFPSNPDPLFRIGLDAALRDVPAVRERPARRALPPAPRAFRALRVEAPDSATAALARQILRDAAPGGYSPERVLAAVDRLYTTGLFEGIWPRAEYDAGGGDPILVVRVEAQPTISLAGALGYDTDRGGRAWGAWQQNRSFLQAPAVLTASASLDRIDQWGAVSLRVFPLRLSPVAFTGGAALREVNVRLFDTGDDEPVGDIDVVRAGGWAGVDYQMLLAERVGSATLRAEWVDEEGGRSGLAVGPYLRVGSPRATEPIVGLPLEAEAEARWGRFSYRRLAARGGVGTRLAGVRLAAVGDVALASSDAPADALPALGDRHRMPGLRWGQGRGQSLVVGGADAAVHLPIGAFGRVRGRVGGVGRSLGDLEEGDAWLAGVEAGLVFSTPFGAINLSYGVNTERGDLLVLDLGPRF